MSMAQVDQDIRTACHGCRTMREVAEQVGPHSYQTRTMIMAGDGTVSRARRSVFAELAVVEQPCPVCGDSDTPGWVPGLQPPV